MFCTCYDHQTKEKTQTFPAGLVAHWVSILGAFCFHKEAPFSLSKSLVCFLVSVTVLLLPDRVKPIGPLVPVN